MTKNKVYWLCQIVGWNSYGLLQILLYTIAERFDTGQISGMIFQVVFHILLTHSLRYSILHFGWLNLPFLKVLPVLVFSITLLSLINYCFVLAISYFKGEFAIGNLETTTIVANLLELLLIYLIWAILYFIFHYVERYNHSLKVETLSREVELKNLRTQLNPHFIFNALNSIKALVDENPGKSKESINRLSHILRNSLTSDRKKLIPFSEELKTVTDYLELESIRYEKRLTTFFHIDPESGNYLIPPLMLQTLVENSIKHGISNLIKGGVIAITTRKEGEHLILEIRNTGQVSGCMPGRSEIGIKNTKKRLKLIFGDETTFEIKNEDLTTVLTKIRLPNPKGIIHRDHQLNQDTK